MDTLPPSPENARNKLKNILNNKKIEELINEIDSYVKEAEDWDDDNNGIPVVSKEKLDKMIAKLDKLRGKIGGGTRRRKRKRKRKTRKRKKNKSKKKRKKRRRRTRK